LLSYRYERDATTVEDLHEFGKIGERSRQPVDLIDDDHIDLACFDIGQQPLQRWPLHRAAGIPAVIILSGHKTIASQGNVKQYRSAGVMHPTMTAAIDNTTTITISAQAIRP
jgi:hypothetical protein